MVEVVCDANGEAALPVLHDAVRPTTATRMNPGSERLNLSVW
jgi:hypothetical protein